MDYEKVYVDKGIDPNVLLATMKNGGGQMDPATLLALANDKDDDYFKWIILLGILRGGFFGDDKAGAVTSDLLSQNITAAKDQVLQNQGSIKDLMFQQSQGIADRFAETRQAFNDGTRDLAQCCCETQRAVDGVGTQVVQDGAATRSVIQNSQNVLQQELCNVQHNIDKCCCETQLAVERSTNQIDKEICALANAQCQGFADTKFAISEQTNFLATQATANTQRIIDGQQRILDTMSENRIRELEAANTQLRTEALIQQQTRDITQQCGCCTPSGRCHQWHPWPGNGNGGPPGPPA